MEQVQLMLGEFPFTVSSAEYDSLSRQLSWRWQAHERLNRKPAMQFQGPDAISLTLNGTIHIESSDDLLITDAMKQEADKGQPLNLLVGNGLYAATYNGLWVITNLDFEDEHILGDGTALTTNFVMTIKEYGEDEA